MTYSELINSMTECHAHELDIQSPGIDRLTKFMKSLETQTGNRNTDCLNKLFLSKINLPYAEPEDIEYICREFNIPERVVRDYFRNKRNRTLKAIKGDIVKSIEESSRKIQDLDTYIKSDIYDLASLIPSKTPIPGFDG